MQTVPPKATDVARKTYKRETALVLLTFLMAMFVCGAFGNAEATRIAEFLTLPVFTFAGGAFAIDAAFKQGGYGRGM